jgi:hypothetical protein
MSNFTCMPVPVPIQGQWVKTQRLEDPWHLAVLGLHSDGSDRCVMEEEL